MGDEQLAPVAQEGLGPDWRHVLRWTTIASLVVLVIAMILVGFFPPLLIFFVLWGIGLWRLSSPGKLAPILLLIAYIAFFGLNAPFLVPQLQVPASAVDFILAGVITVLSIVGIVASIAVLRNRDASPSRLPRGIAVAAVVAIVVVFAAGAIAKLTYKNATAQPGDLKLTAHNIEFSVDELDADSGELSVFVQNKDTTLHTFTIEGLDVDLEVPAGSSARVTFDAPAGTYKFYCRPHEPDMHGQLTVH